MNNKKKQRPELGAVIVFYLCAIGMFLFFAPPFYFYLNRCEVEGKLIKTELAGIGVKYFDDNNIEYFTSLEGYDIGKKVEIGEAIIIHYSCDNPNNIHIPKIEGNRPYFLYLILILFGIWGTAMIQYDYIKYK